LVELLQSHPDLAALMLSELEFLDNFLALACTSRDALDIVHRHLGSVKRISLLPHRCFDLARGLRLSCICRDLFEKGELEVVYVESSFYSFSKDHVWICPPLFEEATAAAQSLLPMLAVPATHLRGVSLQDTNIGDIGLRSVLYSIAASYWKELEYISLAETNISDVGGIELVAFVQARELRFIREIDVSFNSLSEGVLCQLRGALPDGVLINCLRGPASGSADWGQEWVSQTESSLDESG